MLDARLQDEIDILTRREWELLEHLQMVWEPLNIAPELLQKQKFVTISLVPIVLQIIGEDLASFQGQNCSEPQVSQCLTQMAKVWDDRYGEQFPSKPFQGLDTTIWLAHVLDPRFKALHVFKGSSTSDEVIFSKLLEKMVGIRFQDESQGGGADVNDAEKSEDSPQKKKSTASSSTSMGFRMFASSRPSLSGGNKRGLQRLSERFSINSKTKEHDVGADDTEREKIKEECQTELDDYKSVQGMEMWIELEDGTKDFEDPLTWWQTHQERFPTLWKLARMYLAIPATCAPSERAFDPEAHSILAKRCQTQTSNSSGVRLFKENAGILSKEAGAKEPEEETEEAVQIVPV